MQKVYLLLRNNQQTGPFNLEELICFDLKSYDLIWIEGKSAGWYYPQEIQALQPYLSFMKQMPKPIASAAMKTIPKAQTSKKVFVSMPSYTKAESTPHPSFNTSSNFQTETPTFSEPSQPKKEKETNTPYSKNLQDVETDYINSTYQKKTKKRSAVSVKGAIAACLVVGIAFAGWLVMKPYAVSTGKTQPEQTVFVPEQNELAADSISGTQSTVKNNKTSSSKKGKKNKATPISNKATPVIKPQAPKKQVGGTIIVNSTESNEYEAASPMVKEEVSKPKPIVEEKKEPVSAELPKEKKKLRDKISDLFKKKPSEKQEDAIPVEEENGKRNSTRRETGSNLAQMVAVKFDIPNDWMMGIKGAKATLTNRSSEAIVKATVEELYDNDDNEVVDKKTISFNDIKSKQTKTISVPDHSTATRLAYNVVSAVGINEPFAKL